MDNFDSFKNYMNQVKAEEELKEKTKKYVREALAARMQQEVRKESRFVSIGNFFARKAVVAACSVAACALMTVSGYAYYVTPVNYISLDINPSVELGINAFDKVVSVKGVNADGRNLIEGKDLTNMPVQETIGELIKEATEQNYIDEDGSTVIAVTSESDDNKDANSLLLASVKGIHSALASMHADAIIYKDSTDLDIRDDAAKLKISAGKLKLINYLQKLDPEVTVAQYRNSHISEIIKDANDLLTDEDTSDEKLVQSDDTTKEILNVGEQLQDTLDENSKGQDINQDQNSDSSAGNSDDQQSSQSDDDSQLQNSDDKTSDQTNNDSSSHDSDSPQSSDSDTGSSGN